MGKNNAPFQSQDNLQELKKIALRLLNRWYFIAIAVTIALIGAWLINRYTPNVYSVYTTVYLTKAKDVNNPAAQLLYGDEIFSANRNITNETIILKSHSLIRQALKDVDFQVEYFREGNVLTNEMYYTTPVLVQYDTLSAVPYGKKFRIQVLNNESYRLLTAQDDADDPQAGQTFAFGQWAEHQGFKFKARYEPSRNPKRKEVLFRVRRLEDIVNRYVGLIRVRQLTENASILKISVTGRIPDKETLFLNSLASNYIENSLNEKNRNATKTIQFIDEQLGFISDSLARIETSLELFKSENVARDISQEARSLYGRMEELESRKAEILVQLRYYGYLDEYLKSNRRLEEVAVPTSLGIDNPTLNTVVQSLVNKQLELRQAQLVSTPENPRVLSLQRQVDGLKGTVAENITALQGSANILKEDLDRRVAGLEEQIALLPSAERAFVNIMRLYNLSESLYLFLMEKRAEAAISKAAATADIKVVDVARQEGGAIIPQRSRNYMIALFFGLLIPVAFIALGELLNTRIRYKDDLERYTDIPFLGVVGHNPANSNLVVFNNPRSAVAESFRSVRSNINFYATAPGPKVFVITSSISGEGKTFCSINLASVFSLSGKKSILIGADMRRPKVYNDFELHNDLGLSNYLAGSAGAQEIIQNTAHPSLDIISGGPVPPNPSELLMGERMDQLIEYLKGHYQYIIIDTPPVGLVTDAFIIMKYADHTVYLVRQNFTPRDTIKAAQEMYENGKLAQVSMLFNDFAVQRYGYRYTYSYGYGYGYGYRSGYYSESNAKKPLWKRLLGKS